MTDTIPKHRILITFDSTNGHNPDGSEKHDAQGAFIPQAVVAARVRREMGDSVYSAPCNTVPETIAAIEAAGPIDAWWYFGHGTHFTLPSIGAHAAEMQRIAKALATHHEGTELRVALFACSTGALKGGLANKLAMGLAGYGIVGGWVDSHSTAAHTTENPDCVRYSIGMDLRIVPFDRETDPLFPTWAAALKSDQRFRFSWPFLPIGDVRNEVAKRAHPEVKP